VELRCYWNEGWLVLEFVQFWGGQVRVFKFVCSGRGVARIFFEVQVILIGEC
jgi:hypothetical protein